MNKKEINLKDFLQSEIYEKLKEGLNNEINNNNISFNLKLNLNNLNWPKPNLIEPFTFNKSNSDKLLIKKLKKQWKEQSIESLDKSRNEILSILSKTELPNWNVNFKSI